MPSVHLNLYWNITFSERSPLNKLPVAVSSTPLPITSSSASTTVHYFYVFHLGHLTYCVCVIVFNCSFLIICPSLLQCKVYEGRDFFSYYIPTAWYVWVFSKCLLNICFPITMNTNRVKLHWLEKNGKMASLSSRFFFENISLQIHEFSINNGQNLLPVKLNFC